MMRFSALSLMLAILGFASAHAQQPDAAPVDANATTAARAVLHELDSISGHATLSGQHNFPNTVSRYSDRIYELTDAYPALFGQDFGFSSGESKDATLGRPAMIQEVIRQYRRGSVIALTWHAVRPTEDEPVTFHDSVQGHLTDWEWRQLLTPGTDLHARWERQVDRIAGYLRELQDAGVPVLFRPYHEMNGNWFWWGGRPGPQGSQELYRQIFDRYVHVHQLHNLVWVWNVNAPSVNAGPIDQYFPGQAYADVISMDIYGAFETSYYDSILKLAGPHKPIALAEVGAMPTLATLGAQPRWAYFMMWSGMAESTNTPAQLQAMFHAPDVIDRNDPRLPAPLAAPTAAPPPADINATPGAHALLARLYAPHTAAQGNGTLTLPHAVEISLDHLSAAELTERVLKANQAGQIPLLRWTPPSPTGNSGGTLDEFEWSELRKPGTALHAAWTIEIDGLADLLQQLNRHHLSALFSPLPQSNTTAFWWGGQPGPEGSQALVRDLFTALTDQHHIGNLVWVWEPAWGVAASGNRPAPLDDFYPGPLMIDALLLDADGMKAGRSFDMGMLPLLGGSKPIGLRARSLPPQTDPGAAFSWFDVVPQADAANTSTGTS